MSNKEKKLALAHIFVLRSIHKNVTNSEPSLKEGIEEDKVNESPVRAAYSTPGSIPGMPNKEKKLVLAYIFVLRSIHKNCDKIPNLPFEGNVWIINHLTM